MTGLDGKVWLRFMRIRDGAAPELADGGYPPYNVEVHYPGGRDPEILRITLAVAGFSRTELEVGIAGGVLLIQGAKRKTGPKDYLHHGIAGRRFERRFALVNGVEVRKAELHNGLLAIELERPKPERDVRKVGITCLS